MLSYQEFRDKLTPAYPITKGSIKLPIATQLEEFDVDHDAIVQSLDDVMQQLFTHNEQAKNLAEQGYDPNFVHCYSGEFTGIVRFDMMFDDDHTLKLVEANTNRPDGLLMHDMTYSVLDGNINTTHRDLFLKFFDPKEHIFICYEAGGFIDPHYLEAQILEEQGYKVSIGTFEDLTYKDGKLSIHDQPIDVLRLSMNSGRFTAEQYAILSQSDIRFVNTFDLAGLADKSLLEHIQSPLVMQTHLLNADNYKSFLSDKDKYVLKPRNLNEGIGVMLGIDSDQATRDQTLLSHLEDDYLIQDYISLQTKQVQLYDEGTTKTFNHYYDYCPHLFYRDGTLIGTGHTLVRYAPDKIVNVMRGGGIGYAKQALGVARSRLIK